MLRIGIVTGVVVALLGSAILSLYPYIPFVPVFLAVLIPSLLVFVLVSYRIKPDSTKFTCWLSGSVSLFVISMLAFSIKNYMEAQSASGNPATSLNRDAVMLANIFYSLGAAILFSPLSYFAVKKIVEQKNKGF